MKKLSVRRVVLHPFGLLTVAAALLLTAVGLITVYSVTYRSNSEALGISVFALALGMAIFGAVAAFDICRLPNAFYFALFGVTAALLLLTLFIGEGPGNRAWLRFSWLFFDIQPSELAKVSYILTLSRHLTYLQGKKRSLRSSLLLAVHVLTPIVLVLLEGDVGNASVLVCIAVGAFLFFGSSLRRVGIGAGIALLLSPAVWFALGEHRQDRIIAGLNPYSDPLGYGWQSLTTQNVIASSSLFGKGFLNTESSQQIPAVHTDMIFAAIAEQFGFVGAFSVILCLFGLCAFLTLDASDRTCQGKVICFCAAVWIGVQAVESIGMCLGLLPIVGVALPFVSYGGSSMTSLWILLGVAFRAGRSKKMQTAEQCMPSEAV